MTFYPPRLVTLIGGARSGKSQLAQNWAEASGFAPVFLATARAPLASSHESASLSEGEREMQMRIAHHRASRSSLWTTVEEPLALCETLLQWTHKDRLIVVDCLTLWISNLLLDQKDIDKSLYDLSLTLPQLQGPVIFVTNEVGAGIVPMTSLGRAFRDHQGRFNQVLLSLSDQAFFVIGGHTLALSPPPPCPFL